MFYKNICNGYIYSIGAGKGAIQITEEAYNEILNVIHSRPATPEGHMLRLKTDLTWEIVELPEPEEELIAEEALAELVEVLA